MNIKDILQGNLYIPENFIRNALPIDATYQYEILSPHHIDRVVQVFTEAFCYSEPMTHYLKMDKEKYRIFAHAVVLKAAQDQCSIVTLDNERVVAFALVEDLANPGKLPDFDPKFNIILALLDKLGSQFFEGKQLNDRHVAHLFITAVDSAYRHQGISTQVNFHAMDLAAQQGFDFMYCEFTHFFNEKGTIPHLKNPKKLIGSQNYRDFILENEKPFEHLEGGANSYLWEIRKNASFKYRKDNQEIIEKL